MVAGLGLALVAAAEPLDARGNPPSSAAHVAEDPLDLQAWGLAPDTLPRPAETEQGSVEIIVDLEAGDSVSAVLARAGAAPNEAKEVEALLERRLDRTIAAGTKLTVGFGARRQGKWTIARIALHDSWGTALQVARTPAGRFAPGTAAARERLLRFRGRVAGGLYWSLRGAGVEAEAAGEYLHAIADGRQLAGIGEGDRFDLVLAGDRLVYAALEGAGGAAVRRVKWPTGERTVWLDPDRPLKTAGLRRPVAGAVSSGFGYRIHPILRFARFHRGVDFRAARGTPVHAAADGLVAAADWHGGYGRQVRLLHPGGLATSYSHLSAIAVPAGTRVRAGEVIGYVGSSGLSTGPHLHFEMFEQGNAVDPMSRRLGQLDAADVARLQRRYRELLAAPATGRARA